MRVAVKFIAVAWVVLSLGWHWAVLQTLAWSGMLLQYAQQDGLVAAISKTFDGRHPCRLCQAIEAGRADERSQSAPPRQAAPDRLDLAVPWEVAEFHFGQRPEVCFQAPAPGSSREFAPPKPRPRFQAPVRFA